MYVYRIEHEQTHGGPFNYNWVIANERTNAMDRAGFVDMSKYPAPDADGISIVYGQLFGTASLRSLVTWFPHVARRILHKYDFVLRIYQADDTYVQIGGHQVAFSPYHSSIVYERKL